MTVSRGFAIVRSVGVSASGAMRSCVEKANKTNDFRHDRRRDDQPDKRRGLKDRRRSSSQNDTRQDVPFWNGPRLRAPFVAQVIGQVAHHEEKPDARSALASYAQVKLRNLFFDWSV
jgi:hypothetical protein